MALAWCFLSVFLPAAEAREPEMRVSAREVRDAVHAVVEAQLDALRSGNFVEAYELASHGIKARFDVRLFAALIRQGYAPLLRTNEADVGVVRDCNGREAQVTVSLVDARRRNIIYRYWLVREEDGWRIQGVTPEQLPLRGDV